MKKLVLFAACAVVLVLSSCTNKAKEAPAQQEAPQTEIAPVEDVVPTDTIPVVAPEAPVE